MKKIFIFALAAAAMTVACQKNQDVTVDPVDETDLVEIKFNTNVATVETKISSLDEATSLCIYGLSSNQKKQVINAKATAAAPDESGVSALTLTEKKFYDTKAAYSFYGYYLDGITPETEFNETNYTSAITITGKEDILLAVAEKNGTYSAAAARQGTHPELPFEHQLSKFKFSAVNKGNSTMSIAGIEVRTNAKGSIIVAGESQGLSVTDNTTADLTVEMDALELVSQAEAESTEYTPVKKGEEESEILVFPSTTYELWISLTQTDLTEGRYIKVPVSTETEAGAQYQFQITVYSLEEIQISATLAGWDDLVVVPVDTDTNDEFEEKQEIPAA